MSKARIFSHHTRRLIAVALATALVSVACSTADEPVEGSEADQAAPDPATAAPATTADTASEPSDPESEDAGTVTVESTPASETAGADNPGEAPSGEGSFVVGLPSFFVQNFTPGATGGSYVDYALWTPLTQIDPQTGELMNMLAQSLESEDQQAWTITLEEGWTFHDGSPVTAQSFADSWNTTALATNALANNGSMAIFEGYDAMNPTEGDPEADTLSGVEVTDELTLSVTLTEPNALLPFILSSTTFAPMPEGVEDLQSFATNPIGNGPFMMQEGGFVVEDQDVILQRYDGYGGTQAVADSVDLRVYQDAGAIYTDFQSGAVDLALLDGADLIDAQSNFPDQLVEVPFPAMIYLSFPLADERFADPAVRSAMSMAIDRDAIVQSLVGGFGTPSTGLAPDTMTGGGTSACDACTYDPEAAAGLLEEAGGFDGPLTLYTYQDPTNERILEAVANQLRTNLGISEVNFEAQPIGQLYESLAAESLGGPSLLYAGAVFPHLYALASVTLLPDATLNVTGYDNPEVVELLDAAAAATTPEETTQLTQEAVATALADLPVAPLFAPVGGLVHAENLSGVIAEPLGGPKLATVEVN